ncbi:hypothetical protein C0989_009061 [Termitomyces sp. Mn162]|nr:hypothetical protein C0989_009061 [Termitomyces sp. Mn162]
MFCDCQHTTKNYEPIWRPDDGSKPIPSRPDNAPNIYRPDILQNIEETLRDLDGELRELSLDVHAHPEIAYEERYTHDVLTKFMEKHGFEVTNHYHLETAWRATFTNREGGRTIGVNSEMDALPGVGHACGHNLIAISGVGVSIAIKKALEKFNLPGTVELLGTPGKDYCSSFRPVYEILHSIAEEVGNGKVVLLDKGAYQNMDACLMSVYPFLAVLLLIWKPKVSSCPWTGRILIPDYSKMNYYVRAPTRSEVKATMKRVIPCFEAAALATGCKVKVTTSPGPLDLRQNSVEKSRISLRQDMETLTMNGALRMLPLIFYCKGDVCYALPSLHPGFAIPTIENGGNHTSGFKTSAASLEAHYACLDVTKALAATGIRVLIDDVFFSEVKKAYDNDAEIQDFFAGK